MHQNFTLPTNSYILNYPKNQTSVAHHKELTKLTRLGKKTWIKFDAAALNTRYQLNVLEINFQSSESPQTIHVYLRHLLFHKDKKVPDTSFCQFFLVAQEGSESIYYNITEYIQNCVIGDLSVAERLIGRTILYIYQTDNSGYDLLSDSGVNDFIRHYPDNYIKTYGSDALIGFVIEPPKFLSVLDTDVSSLPWSSTLSDSLRDANFQLNETTTPINETTTPNTHQIYIPFIFYDKYNSPVIRSVYWQELTSQFVQSFISGMRDFCQKHHIRLAIAIPESSRSLQYDLNTILQQMDCPILVKTKSNTDRQLIVAKSVCSNSQHVGIMRKENNSQNLHINDAVFGFNNWISERITQKNNNKDSYLQFDEIQKGSPIRQILMLSPTQSLWMKPDEKQWSSLTKSWGWFCRTVWNIGYDFDIVSEVQLFKAKIVENSGLINLNGEEYNLVLLPSCLSLHGNTVQCLTSFTKSKGKLIINAPVPYLLNGKIGLEPYLLERLIYGRRTTIIEGPEGEREIELRKILQKLITPTISIYVGEQNQQLHTIKIHHRRHEEHQSFFLNNTENNSYKTLVEIYGIAEKVIEFQLTTNTQNQLDFWHANGNTYVNCTFSPRQSRLISVFYGETKK